MEKRNVLSSPRLLELKKRRRKAILHNFLIIFLGVAALSLLGGYFFQLDGLNIKEVRVSGNKVVDASLIQSSAEEQIAGKYLWLFPKTNVLFYPKGSIKTALQNNFHRIGDVNLSIEDRRTLLVSVSEREAKYMWCGNFPGEANPLSGTKEKEQCYFLDGEGYVFGEAPYFSGEVYFKFYGQRGVDTDNPVGSRYSYENFRDLVGFKDILVSMGLKPVMMNAKDDGDVEVYLARIGSKTFGPKIIFKSDKDMKNIAENLQAALSTEPLMSGFKNRYSSLLYIDLRFGNKVYFKFNDK